MPMLIAELLVMCVLHDPEKKRGILCGVDKDCFTKCAESVWVRQETPHEEENFAFCDFADMTDRPLSYGYARIFSKSTDENGR